MQASWCKKCFLVLGVVTSVVSFVLFKLALDGREKNLDAVQGECNVVGWHVDPVSNVTCDQCKFVVQMLVPDLHGYFGTWGWTPAFHTTYRTREVVVPKYQGFSCCPTRQLLDCCGFYDGKSDTFCDNWGHVQADCPVAPWPCYFKNAKAYLERDVRTIAAHDVLEGSCKEWILHMIIAAVLAGISIVVFTVLLLPKKKQGPRKKEKEKAAVVIQSWVRGILVRRSHVGQRVEARRARIRSLWKRRNHQIALSLPVDPPPLPGCTTPEIYPTPPIISPLPASQNPFQRYLKDTGSGHRLVQSRIISFPGEPIERLEVVLLPAEGPFGAELALPSETDKDRRPIVRCVKHGSKAEACGVQQGHRLGSVGGHRVNAAKPWKLVHLLSNPHSELITAVFELPIATPKKQVDDLRSSSWADVLNKQRIVPPKVDKPCSRLAALPVRWNASLV